METLKNCLVELNPITNLSLCYNEEDLKKIKLLFNARDPVLGKYYL